MFRPSRTGPYPVLRPLSRWALAFSAVHTEDTIFPVFQRAAPRGDFDSVAIDVGGDYALAAQSGITVGLAVNGGVPEDKPAFFVYSLSVNVHTLVAASQAQAALNIRAWFGESVVSTLPVRPGLSTNQVGGAPFLLPADFYSSFAGKQEGVAQAADRQFTALSAKGQLIAYPTAFERPFYIAFTVYSAEAVSAVTIKNLSASMALHKYVGDLDVFDPTR